MLTQASQLGVEFVERQEATRRFGKRKLNGIDKFLRLNRSVTLNVPSDSNEPIKKFVERRVPSEIIYEVATNCRL